MKFIILLAVATFVVAEPPLSKSYLPPSFANRNNGYPQGPAGFAGAPQANVPFTGAPQVIAARALGQNGHRGNGLTRSGHYDQSTQARFNQPQGYDENSSEFARNAIDISSEPANYNFGYMVNDYNEGTDFGHHEERLEDRAQGQYHVVLPDGRKQTVNYEADERGFKPKISYQESDLVRSNGYDLNANTRSHGNGYKNGSHFDQDRSAY
ncbi:pro-resilin-like [Melitaea cinxia]|uniref:pro-resilin-like n=1 Tax=Melitaea cinxia TaxID=113334 RepID=UPI001E272862|nr:pro-resilin-like [Melitaea cinxia]